jgi:hypothetical protein
VSDQDFLVVKNWKEFQHYRDRDPLWIKLYRKLLTDYAFSRLPDASKAHLMLIWLLASESEGRIPNDAVWIKERIAAKDPIDLKSLIDKGFLTEERRKQVASERRAERLTRERDRDREEEQRTGTTDRRATWLTPFAEKWSQRCGNPPYGKLASALGGLVKLHGAPETESRWSRYLDATDPKFCSVHRFAETFNSWAPPTEQEMTDEFGAMKLHRRDAAGKWVPAA